MQTKLPFEGELLKIPSKDQALIDALLARRSTKVLNIDTQIGPSQSELEQIIRIAARVPDHGKLSPWRFIIIAGERRKNLGEKFANILKSRTPNMDENHYASEAERFLRGHTIIAMVSSPVESIKAPLWEQELSVGALGFSLILAAHGFGYAATWLSEWPMFDGAAKEIFSLADNERLAGFFYIGKAKIAPEERGRPSISEFVQYW